MIKLWRSSCKAAGVTIALPVMSLLLAAGNGSAALDPIPNESGFSGYFGPGVGVAKYKGNLIAGIDKVNYDFGDDSTSSLTGEADSETEAIALLNFEIGYNFAESRTRLFLGSTLEDFIEFDYGQQLGVRQEVGSLGVMSLGMLLSNIPVTVWKDPYQVNTVRQDTTRDSLGARFVWDKIFGSGLQLQLDFRNVDIDDEESGTSLGLNAAERRKLDRNGDIVKGDLQYRLKLADKHFLAPSIIYAVDDRDGSAMSSDTIGTQVTYLFIDKTVSFAGNAYLGHAEFDAASPIAEFGYKTRKDTRYGVAGTLFYKNPFGWQLFGSDQISFYGTAAYYISDSNINFYTSEIALGMLGIMYRF